MELGSEPHITYGENRYRPLVVIEKDKKCVVLIILFSAIPKATVFLGGIVYVTPVDEIIGIKCFVWRKNIERLTIKSAMGVFTHKIDVAGYRVEYKHTGNAVFFGRHAEHVCCADIRIWFGRRKGVIRKSEV